MNRPRIRAGTAAQKQEDLYMNRIDTSKMNAPVHFAPGPIEEHPQDENQGRGQNPRKRSPLDKAFRAAWRAFWRELEVQKRINEMPDPLK